MSFKNCDLKLIYAKISIQAAYSCSSLQGIEEKQFTEILEAQSRSPRSIRECGRGACEPRKATQCGSGGSCMQLL